MLSAAGVLLAAESSHADASLFLIELGAVVLGLAVLGRFALRVSISPIPLYLLAGLAFGRGGLVPLDLSDEFVQVGAELGVILLLFLLGLEYTADQLRDSLRTGLPAGALDLVLNFLPGLALGFLLGWGPVAAVVLGGVTYVSSSGVIAKVLTDLDWLGNPEVPPVLSLLVAEDLAMAVYLPVVAVLLAGTGIAAGLVSLAVAIAAVAVVLVIALRFGRQVSRALSSRSDEVLLLTALGLALVVAGVAQRLQVSSAVGAFLIGIAIHGGLAERVGALLRPLRDLFAAIFFLFFGLSVDPSTLPPVLLVAVGLAIVTTFTKVASGRWAAARSGVDRSGQIRAGLLLTSRGEFSIVIAGLAVTAGVEPRLGALATAYVLLTAIACPLLARAAPSPGSTVPTRTSG